MRTQEQQLDARGKPVYLISDIHANLAALKTVLDKIPLYTTILCAGDILGYYTEPNEVCQLLRERKVQCIKGNHDKYILGELEYPATRELAYRIEATRRLLSARNYKWLASLPDKLSINIPSSHGGEKTAETNILIAHGSPSNVEEYIYPDTPIDFLSKLRQDYLVLGHTHHPMKQKAGELTVINPGSVGQPRDWIPEPSYASINPASKAICFYRASYDVSAYQNLLRRASIDHSVIEILSRSKYD
ncbi:metallophosphoesterase [Hoeflea sp. TYP-13]|uniref:metallophosphoesterase n=1 Tax=Hoeflea sp. TYP-13 TaxID=3230023 RepID=UPI0034C6AE61